MSSEQQKVNMRSQVRQLALQYLYATEINTNNQAELRSQMVLQNECLGSAKYCQFFDDIISGVSEHAQALDDDISSYLINWKLNRIAILERLILRMAFWEIDYYQTPTGVAASEAIALSKIFCDDQASFYINGILGKKIKIN